MANSKLLLHACCAPCLTSVFEQLRDRFDITIYWFNPNIHPLEEYVKRLEELVKYTKMLNIPLIIEGEYLEDHHNWLKLTQENTNEPEGGARCKKCIKYRLLNAGLFAKQNGFALFATTLTVSPHKDTEKINLIGNGIANQTDVEYLSENFKENGGYKRSIELCKEFSIYRQKYCGCEYSIWTAK